MSSFAGKVGIVQRVITPFRATFFECLATACQQGLSISGGHSQPNEALEYTTTVKNVRVNFVNNHHFLNGTFYLCWQSGLIDWIEQWNPDVLVVEANARYLSTPQIIRWMHTRQRPVLGWGLGTMAVTQGFHGIKNVLRKKFLGQFDGLIAYSSRAAKEYESQGVPPSRIFVAHNATARRPSHIPPVRPASFNGQANILFVGKLTSVKRLDLLLHACALLPLEKQPTLTVVGDGPMRQEYEALAKSLYPTTQFTGTLKGAQLQMHWDRADLFVLPGQGGLAIQEAMANGLPVIVGEADGTQIDLVRPGNGWNLPANNQSALNQTLELALSDPARLRRMGQEGFRIVQEEINVESMVENFVRALSIISKRY